MSNKLLVQIVGDNKLLTWNIHALEIRNDLIMQKELGILKLSLKFDDKEANNAIGRGKMNDWWQ